MPNQVAFRTLHGIAELEALEAKIATHPNPAWAPEVDQRDPMVAETSRRLFGIVVEDTAFHDDTLEDDEWYAAREGWDAHFAFAEYYFTDDSEKDEADELKVWELLGWEVRHEDGSIHPLLHHFQRQMICAAKGLKGRMPSGEVSDEEADANAQLWAESLMSKGRSRPGKR